MDCKAVIIMKLKLNTACTLHWRSMAPLSDMSCVSLQVTKTGRHMVLWLYWSAEQQHFAILHTSPPSLGKCTNRGWHCSVPPSGSAQSQLNQQPPNTRPEQDTKSGTPLFPEGNLARATIVLSQQVGNL